MNSCRRLLGVRNTAASSRAAAHSWPLRSSPRTMPGGWHDHLQRHPFNDEGLVECRPRGVQPPGVGAWHDLKINEAQMSRTSASSRRGQ